MAHETLAAAPYPPPVPPPAAPRLAPRFVAVENICFTVPRQGNTAGCHPSIAVFRDGELGGIAADELAWLEQEYPELVRLADTLRTFGKDKAR